jgi:quinol monooxygenase YgiN
MTAFIATLEVKPGQEAEFERLQQELSKLSHEREPDTFVYDVIRHREKAGTYVVYARFKDEAAYEHHQTTDFHEKLVPPIVACLSAPFAIEFFDWVG